MSGRIEYKVKLPTIPKLHDIATIMHHLRLYEKIWHEKFGYDNKIRKEYWQQKADEWLKENVDYKVENNG